MASSSKSTESKSGPMRKKKIKVRKLTSDSSSSSSIVSLEDSEEYIPLAARDSKWVGLNVCNSDLHLQLGYESNEELVIMEVNEEEELPIYSLFPSLRNTPSDKRQLLTSNKSTADITKLLVGQKPDFTHMKKSKRFSPAKLSLPKLEEQPNEEKVSDSKLSKHSSRAFGTSSSNRRGSASSSSSKETHYDDESALKHKKVKKYKKRPSIIPLRDDTESSYSGIFQVEQDTAKTSVKSKKHSRPSVSSYYETIKMERNKAERSRKNIYRNSSNGSLADEESLS